MSLTQIPSNFILLFKMQFIEVILLVARFIVNNLTLIIGEGDRIKIN